MLVRTPIKMGGGERECHSIRITHPPLAQRNTSTSQHSESARRREKGFCYSIYFGLCGGPPPFSSCLSFVQIPSGFCSVLFKLPRFCSNCFGFVQIASILFKLPRVCSNFLNCFGLVQIPQGALRFCSDSS